MLRVPIRILVCSVYQHAARKKKYEYEAKIHECEGCRRGNRISGKRKKDKLGKGKKLAALTVEVVSLLGIDVG